MSEIFVLHEESIEIQHETILTSSTVSIINIARGVAPGLFVGLSYNCARRHVYVCSMDEVAAASLARALQDAWEVNLQSQDLYFSSFGEF